jgi:hypothetical protein
VRNQDGIIAFLCEPSKIVENGLVAIAISLLLSKLIPKSLKSAFVNHFVELFLIRVEFEAVFSDFIFLYLDVDCWQVAAED